MTKKALGWFTVEKAGRVVDCIRAKDLCLAFQEAMDKWERWCTKGTTIEVKPLPDAPPKPVIVKPTQSEVRAYAPKPATKYAPFENWPYFSNAALAETE